MRGSTALFCAALCAAVPLAGADATTYFAVRDIGAGTISLRIDTDGTTGRLAAENILDWRVDASAPGANPFTLTGDNSDLFITGNLFSATSEHLFFDYDGGQTARVIFLGQTSPQYEYLITTNFGSSVDPPGERLYFAGSVGFTRAARSDFAIIASVASVPEPESWAMMIGGFLMAGRTLRRDRVYRPLPA